MLIRAITSHYRRHPLQLASLALMIVIATMLWTGVTTLTAQARNSLELSEASVAAQKRVVRADGQPISVEDFVALRRGGICVAPWLEAADESYGRRIGIDPLALACFEGEVPGGQNQSLDGEPFVDISQLADDSGQLSLLVSPNTSTLPAEYRLKTFRLGPATGELADSFLLNLDALSLLVLFITGLLVRSVYHLGLAQRRDSFALLRRFGVADRQVQRLLAAELAVLTLLCVVPGVILGKLLATTLGKGFGGALDSLFDVAVYAGDSSSVWWQAALVMLALVLGVCLLDRLLPQRPDRSSAASSPLTVTGWVLFGALTAGLLLVAFAASLTWVFAGTALVFAGVGGLTPPLLARFVDRFAARHPQTAGAPLGLWRYRELAVMLRRLALPVVALQFAVATVLAVQALVTSFENTFEQWLSQRLSAEWYIEVPEGAESELGEELLTRLSQQTGQLDATTEAVGDWHRVIRGKLDSLSMNGKPLAAPLDVLAVSSSVPTAPVSPLVEDWSLLRADEDPWQKVAQGQVLVNEQLARRYEIAVGDALALKVQGGQQSLRVAGVYADYGRPSGEILMSGAWLPEGFTPRFESFSVNASQQDIDLITERLKQLWQVKDIEVRNNATIKALASQVFQQTFLLTRAISLLTLVLATVSLFVMGWVFFMTRAWYYRLLTAWGVARSELRGQLRRLSLALTLSVTLAALPLGIWLTWVLVNRINPLAFGWSLPMAVYPQFWLELLLLSSLIGLAIAWAMARNLSRLNVENPGANQVVGGER